VIDECDVVLNQEDGMLPEIMNIHKNLPAEVQHIFVSATVDQATLATCRQLSGKLVEVYTDDGELDLGSLAHYFENVGEGEGEAGEDERKLQVLERLLDGSYFRQAIVFCNTVEKTILLAEWMKTIAFRPIAIHSELTQQQRLEHYEQFRNRGARILVATDLFGRGIDIEGVNLVVNYDFPRDLEHYLHRVGRAGRFNTPGAVVSLLSPAHYLHDLAQLQAFQKRTHCSISRLPKDLELLRRVLNPLLL
jgi:ATP-dependent RNA helicase UAP56/SUB2